MSQQDFYINIYKIYLLVLLTALPNHIVHFDQYFYQQLKKFKHLLNYLSLSSVSGIHSVKTFDFSILCTTIPHSKLVERLKFLIFRTFFNKIFSESTFHLTPVNLHTIISRSHIILNHFYCQQLSKVQSMPSSHLDWATTIHCCMAFLITPLAN